MKNKIKIKHIIINNLINYLSTKNRMILRWMFQGIKNVKMNNNITKFKTQHHQRD